MTPTTEYREIPLTKGQVVIVDAADYEWLSKWKWSAKWSESTGSFYAYRNARIDGKHTTIRMHRLILGLHYGDKGFGDHINRVTLDNRRKNLRVATRTENNINQRIRKDNTSGVRGVSWVKLSSCWKAQISVNGKKKSLGYFSSIDGAVEAYKKAETTYFQG